ncbi:MAG: hypothetical protein KF764_31390 [Labilithrix sp.]|nr:hypothetical protein [Labilithrix sp.]
MLGHRPSRLLSIAFASVALAFAPHAGAGGWQEMHETSDDVRVEVGTDGLAIVQHHLRYRIVAGHFKTLELAGVDPRGELLPDVVLTRAQRGAEGTGGVEIPARVEVAPNAPGTIRVVIDEGKGLGRGAYVVDVKYRLDLVATKMLTRDGAMWKLAWAAPPAPEGHDGARVIFDLPAAPTEPRLAAAAESTTTLATLRRSVERDELELVRAHVPRGEVVTWAARIDPKAFPRVTSPELRPAATGPVEAPSMLGSNLKRALVACGFAALAGVLAALLREKQKAVRAAAALRGAKARPLVPMPWHTGPFAYGIAVALALATLLWWNATAGALLVALAMALAAHRAPAPVARPRGPGAWRSVSDPRALLPGRPSPLPTDALDVATTRARLVLLAIACAVIATSWLLRARVPQIAIALPLASAALLPIFVTGTRAELVPTPTELAARLLRPTRDALASMLDLAHVEVGTIGRVVGPTGDARSSASLGALDEIRLVCAPRDRTPGLRAIELALATCPSGHGAVPEVFVRFDDGSAAAERIARVASGTPVVPGRTPEERVVRLSPDEATPRATAALVAKLVLSLEGRRVTDRPNPPARVAWKGKERRGLLVAARAA